MPDQTLSLDEFERRVIIPFWKAWIRSPRADEVDRQILENYNSVQPLPSS